MEKKLNYLEKLQTISLAEPNLWTINNKIYAILLILYENKKLIFENNIFKFIEYSKNELCLPYENKFIKLYNQGRTQELNEFLINLKLTKTLELKGIIKQHYMKSKFNLFNKYEIEKTDLFYDTYNEILDNSNDSNLIKYIFDIKDDVRSNNIQMLISIINSNNS